MGAVSLILIVSAIIFAMAMPHLIVGLVDNSVAFGLPENNGISSFLAFIFGFLIAALIAAPFTPVLAKQFRKIRGK